MDYWKSVFSTNHVSDQNWSCKQFVMYCMYVCMYAYMYVYDNVHMHVCAYYVYIQNLFWENTDTYVCSVYVCTMLM